MDCNGNKLLCLKHQNTSKIQQEEQQKKSQKIYHDWSSMPSVVLYEIFDLLDQKDRINASGVCRHWRSNLFHPKWWADLHFKIEEDNLKRAQFYRHNFGRIVSRAVISLNTLSTRCILELVTLLKVLNENRNLKSLIFRPTHCGIESDTYNYYYIYNHSDTNGIIKEILKLLYAILPQLTQFSIGCTEEFYLYINHILKHLRSSNVTLLGLASVKDDSSQYEMCHVDSEFLAPFKSLQILSIDYDHLCDNLLYKLEGCISLKRLIVHLHKIPVNHPGTTNYAWQLFKQTHPHCSLRLSLIHAYNSIKKLNENVLKEEMPLSHIKAFFCEDINLSVLNNLSRYYKKTLRSFIWIDSLSDNDYSYNLLDSVHRRRHRNQPIIDPLILLSWLCPLEEIRLYGYKYSEINLIGIGRLGTKRIKILEMPFSDILPENGMNYDQMIEDISTNLGRPWKPLSDDELHPVIRNPTAGDSDEFLLPIILQDLH